MSKHPLCYVWVTVKKEEGEMGRSLYSPSWYRVAELKPRLRSHVDIHRHIYRGGIWYVLQDHASGRFQRFTPAVYLLIGLMNGQRTVQEIWESGKSRLGEDAPTQEEMIRLLSQLHTVDVFQSDVSPDTEELFRRYERKRASKQKQNIRNPLSIRFSLLDPERFLVRFQPFIRPLFSWLGISLWFLVVGAGVFQAGVYWPDLTENVTDRVLAHQNLLLLWLTFPFLKILHEFGHAFAIKAFGGEVHEMGIMMLVFTPIPYVDASAALAFRNKWERILVGAAGMAVELFIASLALFLWINIEPGNIRSLLYNIIFIAGVSSLLFNGNPLLRYDSYYILGDFLEIPNLGPRGLQYMGYLVQRYLFRIRDLEPPFSECGERIWFFIYTVTSFIYRIFIYIAIVLFIAGKFFIAGMILAGWTVFSMIILPIVKGMKYLIASPRLHRSRSWAMVATTSILAGIVAIISLVPVPLSTITEGVIWLPEQSFVRAGVDGFVERFLANPGSLVRYREPLIESSDPLLPAQIRVLESKVLELKTLYETQVLSDRVKAEITNDDMKNVSAQLERARENFKELTVHSSMEGTFFVPSSQNLPGRFVRRGELLGYVLDQSTITARVVISQSDIDSVRQKTSGVQIRFPENISKAIPSLIKREVPAATDQLPGRTLSQEGGGGIAVDPRETGGVKAFQKVFLFDIELPAKEGVYSVGGRVYVRFDHGWEPLIGRWYRRIRQLFLRRFHV